MKASSWFEMWLLVLIGTLPELIKWLTLSWDASPRGVSILVATLLLGAAVNIKAYLSNSTSTTATKDSVTIEKTGAAATPQTKTEPTN
jgi:hypothetical protein